jgi:GH15 family glucan-1,4-alpha-glucosidase
LLQLRGAGRQAASCAKKLYPLSREDATMRIEDYGLIGDLHTAALVGRNGSIDWLCLPRFDSGACFAALLGRPEHGHWQLAPVAEVRQQSWRYREGTAILESELETDEGAVRIIDFMPERRDGAQDAAHIVRIVEGLRGRVAMRSELVARFDYGSTLPLIEPVPGGIRVVAGPDALFLHTPSESREEDGAVLSEFEVREAERVPFVLRWNLSHLPPPEPLDGMASLEMLEARSREWSDLCTYQGEWREAVVRSLITLKGMTYRPTGGLVAAPTTSLPEALGGVRNWDYRYCWIRDSVLTLRVFLLCGYTFEALAFGGWLQRAITGHPKQAQIMYGLAGERRLAEATLDWLPGYEGSAPVRLGNAAADQFQLDIWGEAVEVAYVASLVLNDPDPRRWRGVPALMQVVEEIWREPDMGIWEVRGPRRHFTHSKVMAWVAVDRVVRAVEHFGAERLGIDAPLERWRAVRDEIHAQVCQEAYDPKRRTFTQYYGSEELDASVLLIPAMGFLPPSDERVVGTVEAVQRWLTRDGFVDRYTTAGGTGSVDGLPGVEGAFLPCSFWLVDALAMIGRREEARALFERLLALRNDLGLLSEEYDPIGKRQLGNFPQAFTHLALVGSALRLSSDDSTESRIAGLTAVAG